MCRISKNDVITFHQKTSFLFFFSLTSSPRFFFWPKTTLRRFRGGNRKCITSGFAKKKKKVLLPESRYLLQLLPCLSVWKIFSFFLSFQMKEKKIQKLVFFIYWQIRKKRFVVGNHLNYLFIERLRRTGGGEGTNKGRQNRRRKGDEKHDLTDSFRLISCKRIVVSPFLGSA